MNEESRVRDTDGAPQLERDQSASLGQASKGKKEVGGRGNPGKYRVTFIRYCHRRIDPDNVWIKGAMDGLVKAGILPDDSFRVTEQPVVTQVLVPKREATKTRIIIERNSAPVEN